MENYKLKLTVIDTTKSYEGYLWWSDKTKPDVYRNEKLPEWKEHLNPFIIEGQLYDNVNQKSYTIRFVDGNYLVNCFDLNELNGLDYIPKEYLSNRIDGVSKLCFREYWRPVEDELCEGMEVLQPAEVVFVGFKNKED